MVNYKIDLKGEKHGVLLIHGLTGSPFEMKYLAKRLNKAGFSVKGPYLEGHGMSLKDLSRTHWNDWYQSVRESFLEMKASHESVSAVGLCMGALLALHLAREFGSELKAVSLISTTLFYDGWNLPWYRFLLPLAYYTPIRYFYSFTETDPFGIKNKQVRARIVNLMENSAIAYTKTPAPSLHELFKLARQIKRELHEITTPTLILHSKEDDLTSPKNADYVEKRIGSTTLKKVILDDCYHMMTIDNQKDLVADETIRFFSDQVTLSPLPAR
jgi:carboxylesterase